MVFRRVSHFSQQDKTPADGCFISSFITIHYSSKKGLIRPLIDSTLPLSQAAYAHERIANNQARGAIILIP
ncbi:zinc-binding dehydrogenase [Providencia alcalifaciens]|uniref:zinc-binding dehydrogenase n=1 Tax=Providencia alcalifaciens TaxID=126385 RepID=UPI003D766CFF